ncbi:hypothetical protein SCUCBS95973_005452 [Sporothrix curviconia]|uniref:Translation initiation factor eIF2B subunit delta n=1 Tax=Sporothrix curviconia TaxID=1260050 RepID=A0ABP0BX32_9PEZI
MSSGQPPEAATGTTAPPAKQDAKTEAAPAAAAAAATGAGDAPPKKLSGAELKAQKQAEKAKRRAAVIAAKEAAAGGAVPGGAPPAAAAHGGQGGSSQPKQGKAKGGQNADGGSGAGGKITGPLVRHSSNPSRAASGAAAGASTASAASAAAAAGAEASPVERQKDARAGIPECFSHLPMAKRISIAQAHKDVHPAVLAVGQQMASFVLRDNVARLEATLVAFKKVIESYQTPPGNAFSRHFVSHVLNPQIEYLTECRPMCFAMGNGIRLLKARVSQLDLDTDDADAIADLCESIDGFIQERIFVAAVGIAREAASMINDGDVILTYGGPRLVRAALEQAWDRGLRFDLIVVEDASNPAAGQALAKQFRQRASSASAAAANGTATYVTYCPSLDGIDSYVSRATTVFLGIEAVFANGALLAPAGTNDVALAAQASGCSVIALCETVNFDRDRVATDALAHNEIDPDRCDGDAFRLLFDITQSSSASMLICEYEEASGMVPAHAIYQVMRTREDPN